MADILPELKAQIKATEAKYGDLPKGLLEKLADIESKGGRNLVNPKSSARGPFQFMKDVGPEFGLNTEADRMDFAKSTDAAARLLLRNKKDLERQIGRPATQGELYLAHQQGATGAAKLLKNANRLAAEVVGDPERIRLNGGDPATMTAGAFATKWTSKIDGGAATAPAKKQPSLGSLGALPQGVAQGVAQGVTPEKDFYDFNGADMAKLDAGQAAVGRLGREPSKVNQTLADVPATPISRLSQLVTGTPEQAAERMEAPTDEARPSRKDTAILAGLSTLHKTAARLAEPLASIQPMEDEATAPSGIAGEFSRGVTAGLQGMNADQEYFGAIIDTITGNEAGAKSRIFNAQQYEEYSAKALQGMQSFEEFTNAPTFDGFISQVVSAAGQVAPTALESIASALATGGLWSLGKTAMTQGSKVVAKTLVKDLVAKKAKGKALDAAEEGILDGLYKNFKTGAMAGAFGSEYKMMSGSAFSEFGDAGAEMNAENAVKSLLIGAPQAAIGVGGEFAILKMLGTLATKKATRSAKTSVLKKFAQEVARTGVKAGMLEGATEVGQETISVLQRNAIDPTFTMQDAQMRIGQAAFAGFFGGGLFGGAASIPASGVSAARSTKIIDNAKKFLKDAAEARTETEVTNEVTGVDDATLGGVSTEEASSEIDAQVEVLVNPDAPKNAVFAALDPSTPPDVAPGQSKTYTLEDGPNKGEKVTVGHIPGKGLIMSQDPPVVDEVMTTAEIGGDVDAAIGEAIGYVGGKDGNEVVRVKNKDGAVVDEAVTNEENKLASATRAEQIASATPGAQVDIVPVEQALEERNAKASLDRKEFNAEASALLAMRELLESEDDKAMDEKATAPAKRVEKHSQPTEPFLGKSVRPAPYHKLSNPDESATERAHQDELHKRVRENNFTVQQVPLKGLVSTQDGISDKFRGVPANGGMHGKLPLIVKFKGVSYIEDGHHRLAAAAERGDQTVEARVVDLDSAPKADAEIKSKSMLLNSTQGDRLLADNISAIEEDTSYENLKAVRNTLRKEATDSLGEPKPAPRHDLTPAEIHAAHDRQEAEAKRRVSIERAVSLLNDAIDAHEIAREEGALSPDLQRVIARRTASAVEALRSTTIKTKPMKLGDEPKEITPEEQAELDEAFGDVEESKDEDSVELTAEEQLAQTYTEIDKEAAVRIEQYNERSTNRDPTVEKKNQATIDKLWLALAQVTPDEAQFAEYSKYKDRMPIKMLEKLIELNESNNNDGNLAYYDVAEDVQAGGSKKLSITQRDPFPNAETTVTRDAVRDVLKQVENMPDPKSTLRKTEGKVRAPSMFWLVNRRTGVAYRLNGTPKTKNAKGRTGIDALAQAGTVLNARIGRGPQGKAMTKLQARSQGLMTMLGALTEAGFDLKVGKYPTGLVPFDQNKLDSISANEIVSNVDGQEYTINDVLDTKPPLDLSTSDPDAGEIREEISKDNGPDEFAAAEDKKKKLNNADDELQEAAERNKARRETAKKVVDESLKAEKKSGGKVDAAELIEAGLEPIPNGVSIVIRPLGSGFQATVRGPNVEKQTVTAKDRDWVLARAHALAVSQPDTEARQYNRLLLETTDATVNAQNQHPEILGVPAAKDQTSVRAEGKTGPGTNKVTTSGSIGKLTSRVLGLATNMFNLHRPLTVITLPQLKKDFDKLTGEGGKFARARDTIADVIDKMDDYPKTDSPGHVLMGGQYLIILRDEPRMQLDKDGETILSSDDAGIAAVLAHEIGHIVFEQEYASQINDTPLKGALWKAYLAHRKTMEAEGDGTPGQYTKDFGGFEEWYADQVMAHVYNKSGQTKGIVDGVFKRVAKALHDFFTKVNTLLGGRLKLSREKIEGVKFKGESGKVKDGGTFSDYMEAVIERNKEERRLNNTFPVDDQMKVRSMILNLQNRIPANVRAKMQTSAKAIMSSGKWGNLGNKLMYVAQASADFMGMKEHGEGGAALKTFFGTLSQSMDKLGWNKRELFAQNLWNNRLADILKVNDKTNPKEFDSPKNRAIMIEAMDEDIDDANLSTQEAKDIRSLYKKIEVDYLRNKVRGKYYIPNFKPRKNYGGPRMWNVEKIAKDKDTFVAWLAPRLKPHGNVQARAESIWETITSHKVDPVKTIDAKVANDEANAVAGGATPSTPAQLMANKFYESASEQAVMEVLNKILREVRRGAVKPIDLFDALDKIYPNRGFDSPHLSSQTLDASIEMLRDTWMYETEVIRLTPGMDPALKRELAEEVKTRDAYEADPNDPNGWLLPPALAHSQYMHYIARRVEFEKMGEERILEMDAATLAKYNLDDRKSRAVDYIRAMLHSVPRENRSRVDSAIMANLGKFGENMNNWWRSANSVASVLTVFTTLLFTTLTSVTDFAGIAMRSKDFNQLGGYIDGIRKTMTTREFQELARSVGVVTGRTQEHMMIGQGELDYANQTARRMTDAFFRYTGLEYYTKFVRSMAVGMGREFIINTANNENFGERETRYLAELGLTREDVKAWQADHQLFETPTGEKVRAAIARFADEAIIRPDASQRPTWASNPYMQMVWQLKSYYYGFGKTVLGGMGREMKNRHSEDGNFSGAAATAMLYASTIIPLTMMGMASRDWLKWLFQLAIPGVDETPSTSMKLDTTGYMWEIFKRSGTMGPFALGLTTMEAFKFEGIAAPFTANVPMFDLFDDTIFDGDLSRPLPVINNIK